MEQASEPSLGIFLAVYPMKPNLKGKGDSMDKTFTDFLVSWGPLFILIVVWFYLMKKRGMMNPFSYSDDSNRLKDLLIEIRQVNEKLDRIISFLEKQNRGR